MDRFTILREDLDAMSAAGIPEHVIERVVLAMVRYGLDGQEPDFSPRGSDPEEITQAVMARVAFGMVKGRIDKYVAKAGNARKPEGADAKPDESKPEEGTSNGDEGAAPEIETNRNESKRIETDKEYDKEQEKGKVNDTPDPVIPVPEDVDTHVQPTARMETRRRARAGWFDPAHPEGPDDGAWRGSEEARRAVAQRIVSYGREKLGLWDQTRYTEAGSVGRDLFGAVTEALGEGIPPGEVLGLARGCMATWVWELRIKQAVIEIGGTARYPEWTEQLEELREEMDDILHPRAAAYA